MDVIAYRRWTSKDGSRHGIVITDDLIHRVGSPDISRSESYIGSYSTQPSYDLHRYPLSEISYSSDYYSP